MSFALGAAAVVREVARQPRQHGWPSTCQAASAASSPRARPTRALTHASERRRLAGMSAIPCACSSPTDASVRTRCRCVRSRFRPPRRPRRRRHRPTRWPHRHARRWRRPARSRDGIGDAPSAASITASPLATARPPAAGAGARAHDARRRQQRDVHAIQGAGRLTAALRRGHRHLLAARLRRATGASACATRRGSRPRRAAPPHRCQAAAARPHRPAARKATAPVHSRRHRWSGRRPPPSRRAAPAPWRGSRLRRPRPPPAQTRARREARLADGGTGLTSASRRASTSSSGVRLAMRCGRLGSSHGRVIIILSSCRKPPRAPGGQRLIIDAAGSHGRKDHQSARAEMPLPALRVRKALAGLKAGDVLIAECTDPVV